MLNNWQCNTKIFTVSKKKNFIRICILKKKTVQLLLLTTAIILLQ